MPARPMVQEFSGFHRWGCLVGCWFCLDLLQACRAMHADSWEEQQGVKSCAGLIHGAMLGSVGCLHCLHMLQACRAIHADMCGAP